MFFKMVFEIWKLLDHLNMTFAYRSLSQVMFFPGRKQPLQRRGSSHNTLEVGKQKHANF